MIQSLFVTVGISLLLYLSGFLVVFCPLPLLFAAHRRGLLPAVSALVLALFLLFLLYRLPAAPFPFLPFVSFQPKIAMGPIAALGLLYFFYYGWIGLAIAVASQRTGSLEKSFAGIVLSTLVVSGLILVGLSLGMGLEPIGLFRETLQGLVDQLLALEEKSGLQGEELLILKQSTTGLIPRMVEVLPALCLNMTLVVSALNILFFRRWIGTGKFFAGWPDFGLWRLREPFIWVPIAATSLFFADLYLLHSPVLGAVLFNLLLVLGAVYLFQGLSIVSWFFREVKPLTRMIFMILMVLFVQVVGVLMIALGLFDFWFDFRKLRK